MARDFNGSDQYLRYASPVLTSVPLTMGCWFRTSDLTANPVLMDIHSFQSSGSDNGWYIQMIGSAAGDPIYAVTKASATEFAESTTGASADTWHHACGVFAANNDRRAFIDGGSKGTNSASLTPNAGALANTSLAVLYRGPPTAYLNGLLAEAAIWNVALSDAEVAILGSGVSPLMVRPGALVAYWPVIGRYSPEIDLIGGQDMTLANSPTAAEHPRIMLPAPAAIISLTAGTPTLSTVQLSWTDNSDTESGFSIERSSTSATSGFSEIDTVSADTTQYDDQNLSAGTYWYRVRAFDAAGVYSDFSEVAEVTVS